MIDLFYHTTPNARKVLIALEEVGARYRVQWTDIAAGAQFAPAFRSINPNAKVPAIVDHAGPDGAPFALFESGAILLYIARKFGKLLPAGETDHYRTLAWLFWQVGGQGPMAGQAAHFVSHAPKAAGIDIPYARERYERETRRHYDVLEGDAFSIADIAAFPWTRVSRGGGIDLAVYPAVKAWSDRIAARPSAKVRPEDARSAAGDDERGQGYTAYDKDQWQVLFGAGQASLAPQGQ